MEEEKKGLQEEIVELEEDNWSWRRNQDYMNGLLEEEKASSRFLCHRIRELEEEIKGLRYRPLWKKLGEDIKPKRRCSYGYSRWYKWKEFIWKVFWVILALLFAIAVFVGDYCLLKHARNWTSFY